MLWAFLSLLAPFWIILFYKITQHQEKGDILSGVGIVCCGIALAVLTV